MSNLYPLFDTGFMFWKSELEELLLDHMGCGLRGLGVPDRHLQTKYYAGLSPLTMVDELSICLPMAAE